MPFCPLASPQKCAVDDSPGQFSLFDQDDYLVDKCEITFGGCAKSFDELVAERNLTPLYARVRDRLLGDGRHIQEPHTDRRD